MIDTNWWFQLGEDWKLSFETVFFHHPNEPTAEELDQLYQTTVLRFTGPQAPYPNMAFELSDLSGIAQLDNLEVLVATHHQFHNIESLSSLKKMKNLFLFNNRIESLKGIESLTSLEQLYVQFNKIESLKPIERLVNLKEVYVHNNNLSTLDGLTEEHSEKLTKFFCIPGNSLPQKELIRVENNLGIKCRAL
ncbi:MAG: leucine-rich repeat domain-containing protein [Ginsengibacter sp.]